MKKIIYLLSIVAIAFTSCQKESIEESGDLLKGTQESYSQTICGINGTTTPTPGSIHTYSYYNDQLSGSYNVNWGVLNGDVALISGQGTKTATFSFGNSFSGGSFYAESNTGSTVDCESTEFVSCSIEAPLGITVASPNWSANNQTCPNIIIELFADTKLNSTITSFQWTISGATVIQGNVNNDDYLMVRTGSGNVNFSVRGTNACGTSGRVWLRGTQRSDCGFGNGGGGY